MMNRDERVWLQIYCSAIFTNNEKTSVDIANKGLEIFNQKFPQPEAKEIPTIRDEIRNYVKGHKQVTTSTIIAALNLSGMTILRYHIKHLAKEIHYAPGKGPTPGVLTWTGTD